MIFEMVLISDVLSCMLWMCRQNDDDIINIYNLLTPYVQRITNCDMLNFGYWNSDTRDLETAQRNLCALIGEFAELRPGLRIIDAGSGFSSPANYWESLYHPVDIMCVNTNSQQLRFAFDHKKSILNREYNLTDYESSTAPDQSVRMSRGVNNIAFINANSTLLPFAPQSIDRVIALESAHHFRPITEFIDESRRILREEGTLIIALPVITNGFSRLHAIFKLGLLYFTWASQHHDSSKIRSLITAKGFFVKEVLHIGTHVYEPLANYYIQNRGTFKQKVIIQNKSSLTFQSTFINSLAYDLVEKIIYHSALKMKELSKKGVIDYIIVKAELEKS
jgi:cyclopropane fatty-acyl-phospholipid synthase-like methyltransferase